MKKRFLSFMLTLTLVGGVALQPVIANAYKNPTINEGGQRWENESNNLEVDATKFNQINETIYPMSGEFSSFDDEEWFVYQARETKKRTFRLGHSSNINVTGAKLYLYMAEIDENGNYNLIFGDLIPANKSKEISFNAVKGRNYVISLNYDGGDSEITQQIEDKIDYFKDHYGHGPVYVMSIR